MFFLHKVGDLLQSPGVKKVSLLLGLQIIVIINPRLLLSLRRLVSGKVQIYHWT